MDIGWLERFAAQQQPDDPDWAGGAHLTAPLARSIQRFQVGESGDGVNLVDKAARAGDTDYTSAVRLFVAEEQNHARLLALLLRSAGYPTIARHWTDTAFVRLRRSLGLRTELLVLLIAEVVALRYYRALRDGAADPLVRDVAARILADEKRHVPFHSHRLAATLPAKPAVVPAWRIALFTTALVVAVDHGPALRTLGLTRRRFIADLNTHARHVATLLALPATTRLE